MKSLKTGSHWKETRQMNAYLSSEAAIVHDFKIIINLNLCNWNMKPPRPLAVPVTHREACLRTLAMAEQPNDTQSQVSLPWI